MYSLVVTAHKLNLSYYSNILRIIMLAYILAAPLFLSKLNTYGSVRNCTVQVFQDWSSVTTVTHLDSDLVQLL